MKFSDQVVINLPGDITRKGMGSVDFPGRKKKLILLCREKKIANKDRKEKAKNDCVENLWFGWVKSGLLAFTSLFRYRYH